MSKQYREIPQWLINFDFTVYFILQMLCLLWIFEGEHLAGILLLALLKVEYYFKQYLFHIGFYQLKEQQNDQD